MENVLIYVRPWNKAQFSDLAGRIWNHAEQINLSEHRAIDESGFADRFYENLKKNNRLNDARENITNEEIEEIIRRCRLLRTLDRHRAEDFVLSAFTSISQVFDIHKPTYVLSVTVDSYVIHILSIVARIRGIEFIALVPTFLNGYFRITTTGAKDTSREVSAEEVYNVRSSLVDSNYKPNWLARSESEISKKALRSWVRNLIKPIWFNVVRFVKRDPLNAHYLTSIETSKRYWSFLPIKYSGMTSVSEIQRVVEETDKKVGFLPLQMSPEATIDYWSEDKSWIDYEDKIFDVIDRFKNDYLFLIKEHPNVLGFRTSHFYRDLKLRKNVKLVGASIASNDILPLVDFVYVCTGSVGFEALVRGVPVCSENQPFYVMPNVFHGIEDFRFDKELDQVQGPGSDELVHYLLEGVFEGTFLNDGSWTARDSLHLQFNQKIADSVCQYLNRAAG